MYIRVMSLDKLGDSIRYNLFCNGSRQTTTWVLLVSVNAMHQSQMEILQREEKRKKRNQFKYFTETIQV